MEQIPWNEGEIERKPFELSNNDLDESGCLDLSIKQIWLIVHYEHSDPGNEFEIVSDKQLVGDSWETLKRGVPVLIAYGNAKVQGTVLTLSGAVLNTNHLMMLVICADLLFCVIGNWC